MNLKRFFRKRRQDADLAAELESHLAHEVDDNLVRGMTREEAIRQAHLKLGNPLVIRDKVWESNRISWLEDLSRDVRYGVRVLAKAPSFTLVAVLVIALGIGANTAIYSFLDALLLRSLPVSDPSSLVVLKWHARPMQPDFVMQGMSGDVWSDSHWASVSDIFPYPSFSIFEKNDRVFSDVFAYCHTREVRAANLLIRGQAESASGELVTGRYFQGLGVRPASGRLIAGEDDRAGASAVVVLSYGFAERHFGSAAGAAGQSIVISNVPFTIVGVAPPEFYGVDPSIVPDFYVPMHTKVSLGASDTYGFRQSDYLDGTDYWLQIMARLRPGVTLEQAQTEIAPKFQQWVATTATNGSQRANLPALYLDPGGSGIDTLRRQFSKPFFLLMTLVALILAIACFNVANLLLARGASRRREIALRLSQGARRSRVVRQLLTESMLLSSMGAASGLAVVTWSVRFLSASLTEQAGTMALEAQLNWHVLGLTAGLALLTGIAFGLAPALQSTKLELTAALKESAGSGQPAAHRSHSWQAWPFTMTHVLVVSQVAMSLLLLVAAGLFVRTLSNLQSINLGFNKENILLFDLNARQSRHRDPEISEFYFRLREQLAAIPGVRAASLARGSLISGEDQRPISVLGAPPDPANRYFTAGPYFLTTMQIPVLAGRDIDDRDRPTSPAVAVINERFAKKNFPGQNPLGHHLILWEGDKPARDMEIVGVAKNSQYGNLKREIPPLIFIPFNQGSPILPNEMTFALRTSGDPLAYVNFIREIVHRADARLPVSQVRTQKVEVEDGMREESVLAHLCTAFAILALTIAAVGLYGTISSTVARRTGEIGIRIALGAHRGSVLWMILREVLALVSVGLAISVPIALGTSKFLQSFLFRMKSNDPTALAAAVAILFAAAILAGVVPARRAARIDPMSALRHE